MEIKIGLPDEGRKQSVEALSKLLAGTYVLYIKTHNYHWNVTGMVFPQLHNLFEEQYNQLFAAADEIAERIRALGYRAPGTFAEFLKLSPIPDEAPGRVPSPEEMIRSLVEGHETLCREVRAAFELADEEGDDATADLLTDRLKEHEKTAWMLRATLGPQVAQPGAREPDLKVATR